MPFSLIDFFVHIIQFLLFRIDKALFFFQLVRHAQIAYLVMVSRMLLFRFCMIS